MAAMRRSVGWVVAAALAMGCSSPLTPLRPVGGTDAAIDRATGSVGPVVVDAAHEVGQGGRPDLLPLGLACRSAADCLTGYCVDGVCCDSACAGPCLACAAPGALGTCVVRVGGTAPRAGGCPADAPVTCGLSGLCDGEGGCALYRADTVCAPGTCVDATTAQAVSVCDGAGRCVRGALTFICAPYACKDGLCSTDDCRLNPADCSAPGRLDASSD
jgi:hypothetical protein